MSTTLRDSAIAILMLSSILCTSASSHAETLKSEKIYFSKESIDQLKDWINSNKSISKEIKIGNFNIPLPPGEWRPLPGGLETGSFIASKNQIGIELYTPSNNSEQMPDYMLSITTSQSIPFTYLPKICEKNNMEKSEEEITNNNKAIPSLDCNTFETKYAFDTPILASIQLYSKENNNIYITYVRPINKNNSSSENFKDKEKRETEEFKKLSNNYLKILNKNIAPLFK
ncbi:hypothetical protein [Aquitalea sp. ASV15]|uniref:hypothetical protein n=1 Tax=Aquitalea sp. ASV15 TaxID=2795104 RepID=UPI0018EB990A|nr:hypothetical protein [Aquitalea sp. ASV15]